MLAAVSSPDHGVMRPFRPGRNHRSTTALRCDDRTEVDRVAGDCMLQPPGIRHRVLENGDGLEVIEVMAPAEHVDHELALPTMTHRPERQFAGQRFVRHESARAAWQAWEIEGYCACDTGIGTATADAIAVRIVRAEAAARSGAFTHADSRRFWTVLRGTLGFSRGTEIHTLHAGDACVLPPHALISLREPRPDLELLEVALAGRIDDDCRGAR